MRWAFFLIMMGLSLVYYWAYMGKRSNLGCFCCFLNGMAFDIGIAIGTHQGRFMNGFFTAPTNNLIATSMFLPRKHLLTPLNSKSQANTQSQSLCTYCTNFHAKAK
jgi:hypothetical protein